LEGTSVGDLVQPPVSYLPLGISLMRNALETGCSTTWC